MSSYRIPNVLALWYEYRRLSINTSTRGQRRVDLCGADIHGNRRIQAKTLIQAPLKILAALHLFECNLLGTRVRSEFIQDNSPQLAEDGCISRIGHGEEEPAQRRCRGVPAGKQDVEELGSKLFGVLGFLGQGVEEDVLVLIHRLLTGALMKGLSDKVVDKFVDLLHHSMEFGEMDDPVIGPQTRPDRKSVLRPVEGIRETAVLFTSGLASLQLAVDALSEEKFGGRVERESEEERLKVDQVCPAVWSDMAIEHRHESFDMPFFEIEVADLAADELWSQQRSGVLPLLAIGSKLAAATSQPNLLYE